MMRGWLALLALACVSTTGRTMPVAHNHQDQYSNSKHIVAATTTTPPSATFSLRSQDQEHGHQLQQQQVHHENPKPSAKPVQNHHSPVLVPCKSCQILVDSKESSGMSRSLRGLRQFITPGLSVRDSASRLKRSPADIDAILEQLWQRYPSMQRETWGRPRWSPREGSEDNPPYGYRLEDNEVEDDEDRDDADGWPERAMPRPAGVPRYLPMHLPPQYWLHPKRWSPGIGGQWGDFSDRKLMLVRKRAPFRTYLMGAPQEPLFRQYSL